MELKRIVVPLDGSTLAEGAIPTAVQLAKEQRAAVTLMRAVEAPWMYGDAIDAQVRIVREAEDYVQAIADKLRADGVSVDTSVWYGSPSVSIVEAAKAQRTDLIVMTSHGRSGLGRLVMGSVAESVLRGTTVPILLLRAAGAAVVPPDGAARRIEVAGV